MDLDENAPPLFDKQCSQKKCKATLPPEYKWKTCQQCHDWGRLHKQVKRKNNDAEDGPRRRVVLQVSTAGNQSEERQYIIIEDDSTSAETENVSVGSSCTQGC
jgi:hypothetical protein